MSTTTTDRIEKQVLLRAPRARVWRALTDSQEFGTWFQAKFSEPFRPGAVLKCQITYPGYEHVSFDMVVETVEPESYFTYRWHPHSDKPGVDYTGEPMTLVEFTLEEVEGGTLLKVVESGFDRLPLARRVEAFKSNEGGWAHQMTAIEEYVRKNP